MLFSPEVIELPCFIEEVRVGEGLVKLHLTKEASSFVIVAGAPDYRESLGVLHPDWTEDRHRTQTRYRRWESPSMGERLYHPLHTSSRRLLAVLGVAASRQCKI